MVAHFLSKPGVAARLGVQPNSLSRVTLPEPDVYVGSLPGWTEASIDAWAATRPGKGNRSPRRETPRATRIVRVKGSNVGKGDWVLAQHVGGTTIAEGFEASGSETYGHIASGLVALRGHGALVHVVGADEKVRVERYVR